MAGVHLQMRRALPFLLLFGLCFLDVYSGCYVNDCNCFREKIICEHRDQTSPLFTLSERLACRVLYISVVQLEWIQESCGLFPRLQRIEMIDDTACPKDTCAPCG